MRMLLISRKTCAKSKTVLYLPIVNLGISKINGNKSTTLCEQKNIFIRRQGIYNIVQDMSISFAGERKGCKYFKHLSGEGYMFRFDIAENRDKVDEFVRFVENRKGLPGVLMPALQEAQSKFGYIPEEIVHIISEKLKIPTSEIYGVATFYSQFSFVPKGKYEISVCMGTACYVNGAADLLEEFEKRLGIKVGETTPDLRFSIVETRCVGRCSDAPVVVVNDRIYPHFKKADVELLLSELE